MIDTIKEGNFSLRAEKSPKGARVISGYFAVTESESKTLYDFGSPFIETLAHGCFKDVLASGNDVIMTLDHKDDQVFARLANGSLTLKEDSLGLYGEAKLGSTLEAESLWQNIQNELFMDCSFTFRCRDIDTTWDTNAYGVETRRINRIAELVEVAVISAWGAYPETSINARGHEFRVWGYSGLPQPQPKPHIRKISRNQIIRRRI